MEEPSNKLTMEESPMKKIASAYTGPPGKYIFIPNRKIRTITDGIYLGRLVRERKRKELQKRVEALKLEWLKKGVTVKKVVIEGEEEEEEEEEESDEEVELKKHSREEESDEDVELKTKKKKIEDSDSD